MPTSYIPYRLVHAHRPSTRRPVDDSRTLTVPTDRELPDESALAAPLHPDHAVSAIRESSTGVLARVINNGYTLELDHFSLSTSSNGGEASSSGSAGTPLTINFADKLRPLTERSIVPYPQDGRAYVVLLTETDVVYRLKLDLRLDGVARLSAKGMDDWCEEWPIPEDTVAGCGGIGAWTVVDEDTVLLGAGDGGIVRLTRSGKWGRGAHWSASHQRPASKFRLPSLFSRAASDELVVSTAVYDPTGSQTLAYTLSRDYRLRAWNPVSETLLRTVDLRSSMSSSQELVLRNAQTASSSSSGSETALLPDTTDVPLIQVVPHPSSTSRYSHLLVIFLATPLSSLSAGTFLVYRVARAPNSSADVVFAGSRDCSSACVGCTIRGFVIVPPTSADHAGTGWRLAVSWEKRGASQAETVGLDDILQFSATYETDGSSASFSSEWLSVATYRHAVEAMDTAYFDRLVSLDPPEPTAPYDNDDIAGTFIEHLFYPGRFAIPDLETALTEYAHQPGRRLVPQLSAPYTSFSQRFEALVGCDLDMSIDTQTGAPIVDAYREALQLDWLSIWARVRDLDTHSRWALTTCVCDDQVIALTRQGVSALVPEDICAVVDRVGSVNDSSVITNAPESAFEHVYPSLVSAEDRQHVTTISIAGHHLVDLLESAEVADSSTSVLAALIDQIDQSLATLESEPVELRAERLWDEHVEEHVAQDVQITIRQILSNSQSVTDALGDTLHLLGNAVDDDLDVDSNRVFSSSGRALLSSTITSTVQSRYSLARSVLLIALFHVVDQASPADSDDETEASYAILNTAFTVYHRYRVLRWLCEQTGEEMQGEGSYSLLHSLLGQQNQRQALPSTGFDLLFDASERYLTKLDLVDPAVPGIEPREQDVVLAHDILQYGHVDAARRFTSLYPLSSGTAYVRGRALVQLGGIDEAVDLLKQAANGCKDGSLGCMLPFAARPNGLSDYYAHVSSLFGDAGQDGPAIYFGQLALRASAADATPSKSLYTRIFLSNIALGNYEDAYSILAATPSEELKSDLLGQLISAMCENNEVGRLNALGFIGLQPKVEELLSFKARNSDPLRYPNYYKVLYSWHIARGDYRSAGEIMYKQGRRFAEGSSSKVSPFELAAMQARSYLAAINALTLVDKRNAWIALPAASRPSRVNKRRRVSSYIPQDQFSADKRAIDIITLADIQQEYTLVLSQLKLAGQVDDFADHGSSTTPDEVVGLLVQRGSFDLALSTAASLEVDMTPLFQSLSKRCVELSTLSEIAGDLSSAAFLHASPLTSRLRGSPSALALRYLQTALARYDSAKTQYRYRQVVANTLFEVNRDKKSGWEMPGWLVHMEMERDAESWIGRAIKWGWIAEAVGWTRDLLRNATPPELLSAKKANVANIPYTLIDRVLAAAHEGDEKDDKKVQAAVKGLREDVTRRIDGLAQLK